MRRAFTLNELLVVIVIIAIVASILFPVIGRARDRSYQTHCTSNLRQLYVAMDLYSGDHGGWESPPPDSLLPLAPYLVDRRIITCPVENSIRPHADGTYPERVLLLTTGRGSSPFRISYPYVRESGDLWSSPEGWLALRQHAYAGPIACPWHASIIGGELSSPVMEHLQARHGLNLRMRFDGGLYIRKPGDRKNVFYTPELFHYPGFPYPALP